MIYYVSLQALGDNLISLSFLEQLDGKVNILGTNHTKNISTLMNSQDKFNIEIIFDDIPAFYDIRKKGILEALKDFVVFIKYIKHHNIKELVFEKNDIRSRLTSLLTNTKIHSIKNASNLVYENRRQLIEKVYSQKISSNSYKLKVKNPKIIVINPLTRVEVRNIKHSHLKYIISELNSNNYEIYLIDIEKKYQIFENEVQHYLTNTTLEDVKQLIIQSDLYIGGDSFLIHLAYYLKKNYFMVLYRDNDDFFPPNIENDFYIKAHQSADFEEELRRKFKNIGLLR